MKENVELIETVEYTMMNGRRSKYNKYLVKVNGVDVIVTQDTSHKIFEERYRPRVIDELLIDVTLKKRLHDWVNKGNIPNLLLYSQQGGTGKDSCASVIVNELKAEFLSIAANIDRGISVIRENVIKFSSSKSMFGEKKIVIMSEIGDMSSVAVDSLKAITENYGHNCSYIMSTNSMSNISQPLRTRFEILDFNKVTKEAEAQILKDTYLRLIAILDIEGIEYSLEDVQFLLKKYKFSFRELIKTLGTSIIDNKLAPLRVETNASNINDVLGYINNGNIVKLAEIAESINHIQFLEELNSTYLESLQSVESVPIIIMAFNEFNRDIANNVPFLSITFLKFCQSLIKDKVQFKV